MDRKKQGKISTFFNVYKKPKLEVTEVQTLPCSNVSSVTTETNCGAACDKSLAIVSSNLNPSTSTVRVQDNHDIGVLLANCSMNKMMVGETERQKYFESLWKPDFSYPFPAVGKRNLKFQFQWLNRWKWLAYSGEQDGGYCKYCVFFTPLGGGRGSQELGVLVRKPFRHWKNAVEDFNNHEKTNYHKTCVVKGQNWLSVEKGTQKTVEVQQNVALKTEIEQNRKNIIPIIETVFFCGRQGLALRGHRDSGLLDLGETPTDNEGNFRALLRYRASFGDDKLKSFIQHGPRNALYTSPQIQNEIIAACNDIILKKIVNMVNDAECFTILADETTDISTMEQFSIGVRYLHDDIIREDFLQFVPLHNLTGQNLASVLISTLRDIGIHLKFLRGQGYDGASTMSGKFNGCQSHVREAYPMAIYVHCASHSLNLAICDCCSLPIIRNFIGTAKKVCSFFSTPKRVQVLEENITQKFPEAKASRLKKHCETRWIERHDSLCLLEEMLPAVHAALLQIGEWEESDTSSAAQHLQHAIEQSSFLVSVHVLAYLFSLTLPLCRFLQKESVDLSAAINMVGMIQEQASLLRQNAETKFNTLFKKASETAETLGTALMTPRTIQRQAHRCNIPTETPEQYYRVSLFIPLIDHFLNELKSRFTSHTGILDSFVCLMPTGSDVQITQEQEEGIKALVHFYESDVQCSEQLAIGELHMWNMIIKQLPVRPQSAMDFYLKCNREMFPTIKRLLKILVTLPVTTCTSERSFSTLKRLKTYLRNSVGQTRLNGLAHLNIHREIPISSDEVLDEIAKKPRRVPIRLR